MQLADHIATDGSLIENLVAIAIYSAALEPLRAISQTRTLSSSQQQRLTETLSEHHPRRDTLAHAYKVDYAEWKQAINDITTGNAMNNQFRAEVTDTTSFSWHPNRTAKDFAEFYRLVIYGYNDSVTRTVTSEELNEYVEESVVAGRSPIVIVSPNRIGKILFATVISSTVAVDDKMAEIVTNYEALIAAA